MEVNQVNAYVSGIISKSQDAKDSKVKVDAKAETKDVSSQTSSEAVIYEKDMKQEEATYWGKRSKVDKETIQRMKKEADEKTMQLRNLVEKLLLKQSKTFNASMDIYDIIKSGELEVDDETRLQAQKDIADDGYWGVEQTSERLFSFAKALAGNDPAGADSMIEAFKKGYDEAKKKWGGELPDICKKTYDAFLKKMDEWKQSSAQ